MRLRLALAIGFGSAWAAMAEPRPACTAELYFEELLKHPRTIEDLTAMHDEVVRDNPGKSDEQIAAIYERERRAFVAELQRQARQLAQNECGKLPDSVRARRV